MTKIIKGTIIIGILMIVNSCAITPKACKTMLEASINEKPDIIIVPGVPFENGQWSKTMKGRVYWSKYLYDKGITKNVIYSGSAVYSPYYEAEIMAMYAEKIGIPKEHIFTETLAEHSTENVYYSTKKARMLGFKKIAVASDPFQSKMLKQFIRKKMERRVTLIPFVVDTLQAMEPLMVDPEIDFKKAYDKDFVSLPDRESIYKRFRGTLGLAIDTSAYNQ